MSASAETKLIPMTYKERVLDAMDLEMDRQSDARKAYADRGNNEAAAQHSYCESVLSRVRWAIAKKEESDLEYHYR